VVRLAIEQAAVMGGQALAGAPAHHGYYVEQIAYAVTTWELSPLMNCTVQPFPCCPLVTAIPLTLGNEALRNAPLSESLPPPPITT